MMISYVSTKMTSLGERLERLKLHNHAWGSVSRDDNGVQIISKNEKNYFENRFVKLVEFDLNASVQNESDLLRFVRLHDKVSQLKLRESVVEDVYDIDVFTANVRELFENLVSADKNDKKIPEYATHHAQFLQLKMRTFLIEQCSRNWEIDPNANTDTKLLDKEGYTYNAICDMLGLNPGVEDFCHKDVVQSIVWNGENSRFLEEILPGTEQKLKDKLEHYAEQLYADNEEEWWEQHNKWIQSYIQVSLQRIELRENDSVEKDFFNAIKNGDEKQVGRFLKRVESDPSFFKPGFANYFALKYASYQGFDGIVKMLIDDTLDISMNDSRADHALQIAANRGHVEVVKRLLKRDAIVDGRDVLAAAQRGYANVVKVLLEKYKIWDIDDRIFGEIKEKPSEYGGVTAVNLLVNKRNLLLSSAYQRENDDANVIIIDE